MADFFGKSFRAVVPWVNDIDYANALEYGVIGFFVDWSGGISDMLHVSIGSLRGDLHGVRHYGSQLYCDCISRNISALVWGRCHGSSVSGGRSLLLVLLDRKADQYIFDTAPIRRKHLHCVLTGFIPELYCCCSGYYHSVIYQESDTKSTDSKSVTAGILQYWNDRSGWGRLLYYG